MFSSVTIAITRGEARPLRCRNCIRPYNKWSARDLLFLPIDSRHIRLRGSQEKGGTVGKNRDDHHGADGPVPRGLESMSLGGLSPPDGVLRGGRACDRQEAHQVS